MATIKTGFTSISDKIAYKQNIIQSSIEGNSRSIYLGAKPRQATQCAIEATSRKQTINKTKNHVVKTLGNKQVIFNDKVKITG